MIFRALCLLMPLSAQSNENISLIKAKYEQEYLHSLKNKLATLKAIKAPFSKLSGNKTLFITTVLSLSAIAYFIWRIQELIFLEREYIYRQANEKDSTKYLQLGFAFKDAKSAVACFYSYIKYTTTLVSIPWYSAIVNKLLGWSCESLEQDIKIVRREDV